MFKAQKIFRSLLLATAIFTAGCMNNSGTEIPNGAAGVTGRLTDANGNPVSGAVVQALPVNYVPSLTLSKSASTSVKTDAKGYYKIIIQDTGTYNIDCSSDTLGAFIDSVKVLDVSNDLHVPDHQMKKLGGIKGISHMGGQNDTNQVRVTLYIPGTGRITKPVIGGAFKFEDVPEGRYRIIIDPTLNDFNVKIVDVTVLAGQMLNLDTVKLGGTDIEAWNLRASGTVSYLAAVVWTGTQLVTVGSDGTILTSPNGVTWTIRNSGTTIGLTAITWTGSRLVAVGGEGTIISSSDGITWQSGTADARFNDLTAVIWTGNQLVAAGSTGILTSTDGGFNWVLRLTRQSFDLKSLTWASNHLVAAYNSGHPSQGGLVTSPDGITWTDITFPAGYFLSDIVWAGTEVVAATNKGILTSTDDINWTLRSPSPSIGHILWKGDETLVVSGNTLVTSQDRVNWTTRTLSSRIIALAWTGTHLVGVGAEGIIVTSP